MPDGTRRNYLYLNSEDTAPVMFCDVKQNLDGETEYNTYYIHNDSFSRPLFITDSEGKIVWSAKISAYGKADVSPDSVIEYNFRLVGQYYDLETGLHYNYHRYYDPETCRYMQPDPIGLAGNINLYAYGEGNPFITCEILGLLNACQRRLQRLGLADENGNLLPFDRRRLGSVLQGMSPRTVRQTLRCLGYRRVSRASYVTDRNGDRRNDNAGGSQTWRYDDPDGRTVHYVRIDDAGHEPPPGESAQTRIGSNPHYHVDSVDSSAQASPISDRVPPGQTQSPRDRARADGVPMDQNGVPLDRPGGRPLNQSENYEQRYEPGATTYDANGNPSRDFEQTHHTFPGSQYVPMSQRGTP
jgi:RHS repeat-associated protein